MSGRKTAIITGVSRGIGAGLVEAFLKITLRQARA
jgi:NAD(P)-dependent dehydrogenase (short-subunit alcohol dehydrogenase family)